MAKLHFYYSAMNAGKSTTLLQSSYNYQERGMKTLLLTPAIDQRFGECQIASRIGLAAKANTFTPDTDLFIFIQQYGQASPDPVRCVLVDEAQFLTRQQVWQLTDVVDQLRIPVLAYGLRSDFRAEPFVGSQYLMACAEEITEIKTICHCGHKAIMTLRIDGQGKPVREGAQIEIGGNERYVAVCRQHWKQGELHIRGQKTAEEV